MAYRRHDLAALIVVAPELAVKRVREAFVEGRASREAAALLLGCKRATLLAWVRRLGMQDELEQIEKIAKRDGWHHGRLGGAGCHSKKKALVKS